MLAMDRRSRPGPEPTTLEAVGNQWCYALVVVQAGDDDDHSDANIFSQRMLDEVQVKIRLNRPHLAMIQITAAAPETLSQFLLSQNLLICCKGI